tara:strand:- start:11022 stop:12023 length:1002 start_codon:yes stop_codon:yes gene_type:complete
MKILCTGGAGYIGSHVVLDLISKGHEICIIDNLSNSSNLVIDKLRDISLKSINFYNLDLLNAKGLSSFFNNNYFDLVIHFAAKKSVSESVKNPLLYYANNITGALNLLSCMSQHNINNLVFSSSATVYGQHAISPIPEHSKIIDAENPYGRSKLYLEKILEDFCYSNPSFKVISLRYFNPGGARPEGGIGESSNDTPNNIIPIICNVASGKLKEFTIFGNNYDTHDGTCIRDYIHISDLSLGHIAAIEELHNFNSGFHALNLGTGKGSSVLEIIKAFEAVNNMHIPFIFGPRRSGDVATAYTDPSYTNEKIGWKAKKNIEDICLDAWNWQKNI